MKRRPVDPQKDRRVFSRTAKKVNGLNGSFYTRTGKRL